MATRSALKIGDVGKKILAYLFRPWATTKLCINQPDQLE
ncbi:hypothetical protein Syn6312_1935 [Synechococcus sp. PCC 6312]|nr:hypothetical protein Syn6312_1935 [Synechococcus sp. PCC 6312]